MTTSLTPVAPTAPYTGTIDLLAVADAVTRYRSESTPKGRSAVRALVNAEATALRSSAMTSAMVANGTGDLTAISAAMSALMDANVTADEMTSSLSVAPPVKIETDPMETIASRVRVLLAAAYGLASGALTPDGLTVTRPEGYEVNSDTGNSLDTPNNCLLSLAARVESAADSVTGFQFTGFTPDEIESAQKVGSAKITRSGERNPIDDVIERAFADRPLGTCLKVSEIRRFGATPGYDPSPGAITDAVTIRKNPLPGYIVHGGMKAYGYAVSVTYVGDCVYTRDDATDRVYLSDASDSDSDTDTEATD